VKKKELMLEKGEAMGGGGRGGGRSRVRPVGALEKGSAVPGEKKKKTSVAKEKQEEVLRGGGKGGVRSPKKEMAAPKSCRQS